MKVVETKVSSVIPYARNPRKNDAAVAKVAASLKEYGWQQPIVVDADNVIIAGHTRLQAAMSLGMQTVPVVVADGLTESQVKAYRLADNRVGQEADWDNDLLILELGDLKELDFDLGLTGFDKGELDALLAEKTEGLTDPDAVPEPPANPVTVRGDIWALGNHRLMCGDSTSFDDVDLLMQGHKADMVFTDPPYGVDYSGGMVHSGKIVKDPRDRLQNDTTADIYTDVMPIIAANLNGPAYIWFAGTKARQLYSSLEDNKFDIHAMIIWEKDGGYGALNANYKQKHEPCIYAKPKNSTLKFCGNSTENTIWKISKDKKNKLHPTQKPVELAARAIGNHSVGLILDLFGGSGSTLIACETLNRNALLMELSEQYCDVIINRWQDFTGKQATLNGRTYEEVKNERQAKEAA